MILRRTRGLTCARDPRFTNGSLDDRPEAFVGLRRRIPNGELTLGYTSALTTIIGTVGATRTDSVGVPSRL